MEGDLTSGEIVNNIRWIFAENLVITRQLEDCISHLDIIGHASFKEIKKSVSRRELNERMLDLLSVRGRRTLELFSEALLVSGFSLLSDVIREQLFNSGGEPFFDLSDFEKKAPKCSKLLGKKEVQELAEYMKQKVLDATIKEGWLKSGNEKAKAMEAKRRQLEDRFTFSEILKVKDDSIQSMESMLQDTIKDSEGKEVHLKNVTHYLDEVRQKHLEEMHVQMKYNQANDRMLQRHTMVYKEMQSTLNQMAAQIEDLLQQGGDKFKSVREETAEADYVITPLDRVAYNVKKLFNFTNDLFNLEQTYEKINEQNKHVMQQLGVPPDADFHLAVLNLKLEKERIQEELKELIRKGRRMSKHAVKPSEGEKAVIDRAERAERRIEELEYQLKRRPSRKLIVPGNRMSSSRTHSLTSNLDVKEHPGPDKKSSTMVPVPHMNLNEV